MLPATPCTRHSRFELQALGGKKKRNYRHARLQKDLRPGTLHDSLPRRQTHQCRITQHLPLAHSLCALDVMGYQAERACVMIFLRPCQPPSTDPLPRCPWRSSSSRRRGFLAAHDEIAQPSSRTMLHNKCAHEILPCCYAQCTQASLASRLWPRQLQPVAGAHSHLACRTHRFAIPLSGPCSSASTPASLRLKEPRQQLLPKENGHEPGPGMPRCAARGSCIHTRDTSHALLSRSPHHHVRLSAKQSLHLLLPRCRVLAHLHLLAARRSFHVHPAGMLACQKRCFAYYPLLPLRSPSSENMPSVCFG